MKLLKIIIFSFLLFLCNQGKSQVIKIDSVSGCLGDTASISINIPAINNVAVITLFIGYDTTMLDFVNLTNINPLATGTMFNDMRSGGGEVGPRLGKIAISWVTEGSGVDFNTGIFATLKFKVLGENCPLVFSNDCEVIDYNVQAININYINGNISPVIFTHPTSTQICEEEQTNFSVTAVSGSTYQWQLQNGAQWDDLQNNTTYAGVNTDSLRIFQAPYALNNNVYRCVVTKTCSEFSNTATLTVFQKPLVAVNNDTTICEGNSVIIDGTGSTGMGTLLYNWDQGLGSGITHTATPVQTTTYHLTVTDANICSSTDSIIVSVNQLPSAAGTISGLTTVSKGQAGVVYTVPTITNATSYAWTLPNGTSGTSTTNNITVDYSATAISGDITVKGINSCGEGAASALSITVNSVPEIVVTPTTLSFGNIQTGTTSTPQTYTVSGTNLTTDITIAAPIGYTVCTTSGGTYVSTLTLTQTGGSIASTTIYVKFSPVAVQAYNGNITNATIGGVTQNIAVTGTGITPVMIVTPTTLSFGNVQIGTASTPQTYTVSGTNLTTDITITAPTGYQICTTSGGTYVNTLTLTQTGGSLASTTIYVKFSPVAVQAYNDNITNATTGGTTQNVAVTGAGVTPVMVVTPVYLNVAEISGAATFAISNTGGGTLNWTASENSTWFSINLSTGINDETITITYDANLGDARSDTIIVTDNDGYNNSVKVVVNQDGNLCPASLLLQNITLASGQTETYQTSASITAAGNNTYFIVNGNGTNGGNVTMASNAIVLNPGFDARKGSVFLAHHSPCSSPDIKPNGNALEDIEYEKLSVRIFPNPTTGTITIHIQKNNDDFVNIKVTDIMGGKIYQSKTKDNTTNVDLSKQSQGLYFVKITQGNNLFVDKVIKQ